MEKSQGARVLRRQRGWNVKRTRRERGNAEGEGAMGNGQEAMEKAERNQREGRMRAAEEEELDLNAKVAKHAKKTRREEEY